MNNLSGHPSLQCGAAIRRRWLSLLAAVAMTVSAQQQPAQPPATAPSAPAEISKPAPAPNAPASGPALQAHPSPAAAANAERAARIDGQVQGKPISASPPAEVVPSEHRDGAVVPRTNNEPQR